MTQEVSGEWFNKFATKLKIVQGVILAMGGGGIGKTLLATIVAARASSNDFTKSADGVTAAVVSGFMHNWMSSTACRAVVDAGLTSNDELNGKIRDAWNVAGLSRATTLNEVISAHAIREGREAVEPILWRLATVANAVAIEDMKALPGRNFMTKASKQLLTKEENGNFVRFPAIVVETAESTMLFFHNDQDELLIETYNGTGTFPAPELQGGSTLSWTLGSNTSRTPYHHARVSSLPNAPGIIDVKIVEGQLSTILEEVSDVIKQLILPITNGDEVAKRISVGVTMAGYSEDVTVLHSEDGSGLYIVLNPTTGEPLEIGNDFASSSSLVATSRDLRIAAVLASRAGSVFTLGKVADDSSTVKLFDKGVSYQQAGGEGYGALIAFTSTMSYVELHYALSDCGLYGVATSLHPALRSATLELASWWTDVTGQKDELLLARTEKKNEKGYATKIYSDSLEDPRTEVRMTTSAGNLVFNMEGSLNDVIMGSMLMYNAIHLSVLNLTILHNVVVVSTTHSGGLESSVLNLIQMLNDTAVDIGCQVVVEMRDDFSPTGERHADDATEAVQKIRATLGANCAIVLHLMHGNSLSYDRSMWIRTKFYGEYADERYIVGSFTVNNLPELPAGFVIASQREFIEEN